jgi:hypothetical protein
MSASTDITYTARPDATPEAELSALVAAYRIVLGAQKEAAPESRPDDAERNLSDSAKQHSTT